MAPRNSPARTSTCWPAKKPRKRSRASSPRATRARSSGRRFATSRARTALAGGIFRDGPLPLSRSGPDGLVNTADDAAEIESLIAPGPDGLLGTADDTSRPLNEFTREVVIRDVSLTLRSLTVIIRYRIGNLSREYTISTLISSYA